MNVYQSAVSKCMKTNIKALFSKFNERIPSAVFKRYEKQILKRCFQKLWKMYTRALFPNVWKSISRRCFQEYLNVYQSAVSKCVKTNTKALTVSVFIYHNCFKRIHIVSGKSAVFKTNTSAVCFFYKYMYWAIALNFVEPTQLCTYVLTFLFIPVPSLNYVDMYNKYSG